jgi:hypothetical protein
MTGKGKDMKGITVLIGVSQFLVVYILKVQDVRQAVQTLAAQIQDTIRAVQIRAVHWATRDI